MAIIGKHTGRDIHDSISIGGRIFNRGDEIEVGPHGFAGVPALAGKKMVFIGRIGDGADLMIGAQAPDDVVALEPSLYHNLGGVLGEAKGRWGVVSDLVIKKKRVTKKKEEGKEESPAIITSTTTEEEKRLKYWHEKLAKFRQKWEELDEVMASKPHRALFHGPPGTNKTTYAIKLFNKECYSKIISSETPLSEVEGGWGIAGGEMVFIPGVGVLGWKNGVPVVIDEINEASGSCLTFLLRLMDDPSIARLTLPNGETIEPKEGFRLIATMNATPDDLPAPLRDRFDVIYNVDCPSPEAMMSLDDDIREVAYAGYSGGISGVTFRQCLAFQRLRKHTRKESTAGRVVFGPQWRDIEVALKLGKRPE